MRWRWRWQLPERDADGDDAGETSSTAWLYMSPVNFHYFCYSAAALSLCVCVCVSMCLPFWLTNTCKLVGLAWLLRAHFRLCDNASKLFFFYMFCLFLLECQLQTFKVSWQRQLGQDAGVTLAGSKQMIKYASACACFHVMLVCVLCGVVYVCVRVELSLCGMRFSLCGFWPFSLYSLPCRRGLGKQGIIEA